MPVLTCIRRQRLNVFLRRLAVAFSLYLVYVLLLLLLHHVDEHAKNVYFGPKIPVKDHWRDFVTYNATAQSALHSLRDFARKNSLALPLFSLGTRPQICVGIATSRRVNSPFKCEARFRQCFFVTFRPGT